MQKNKKNIITYKQVGPITNKNIDEFYKNILKNLKWSLIYL